MAHLHKHERVGRLGKSGGEKKAHPLRKQKTTKGRAPSLPGPRLGAAVCTGTSALPLREAKQRLRHPSGESAERISRLEERMAHASVVHVMLVLEVNSKSGPFQKIKGSGTRRARNLFVNELGRVRDATGFRLIGYVVMPEHVHLLISEPREGTPSTVLYKLKPGVARELRKRKRACAGQLRLAFAERREPLRACWQARFYDFNGSIRGTKQ